jgi:hypothetical protein
MSAPCESMASWETLVDYWAGELPRAEEDALEEHVMGCDDCARASARVAAITETFRSMLAPVIDKETLERLRARGLRILENPMLPGERKAVLFPAEIDLLIHRLGGLDLSRAARVTFEIRDEVSGRLLGAVEDAPFDRDSGTVLIACQKHYAHMPPDTVIEIRTQEDSGTEASTRYTVLHRFHPL